MIKSMRLVGSMTTLPTRLKMIGPTIMNILKQQRSLDVLYLNVPDKTLRGAEYIIPEEFEAQFNGISTTKFVINRCGKDLGPLTKLAPVMYIEKDPDTLIFTFDDDILVHRDVVDLLYNKALKYPLGCVGLSGVCIGYFPFYYQVAVDNEEDIEVDWLQGVHVVAYRRGLIGNPEEMITFGDDTDAKDALVFNDDHRISGYLNSKGVTLISVGIRAPDYVYNIDEGYNYDALSKRGFIWLKEHHLITSVLMNMGLYKREYTITRSILFITYLFVAVCLMIIMSMSLVYKKGINNIGYLIGSIFILGFLISFVRFGIFMKKIEVD
jgi:hypothetical protein